MNDQFNQINDAESLKAQMNEIFDIFHVGSEARKFSVLLSNIKNASRRSNCLLAIENYLTETVVDDETGEPYEQSLLNWGESPMDYLVRFIGIQSKWISVDDQMPENGNSCIATGFDWGKKENNRHFVVCEYFENMWVGDEGEEFKYLTHWMPLPAPPAQGDKS